jgi:alpha-beta hydrolase superfamily lysophospholipase
MLTRSDESTLVAVLSTRYGQYNAGVVKRLLLPVLLVAGAVRLMPEILKRTLAPPQREQPHTPADLGLPEEEVTLISAGGTELKAWFLPVGGKAPAVVVLHGWGANASLMLPLAPHLHRAGFHALFLDARNHGRSEHDDFVSMPRFAEDLDVAIDWLRPRQNVSSIGVIGHSVGAGAAILAASRSDQINAVVSVAAFAHPGEAMAEGPPFVHFPAPVQRSLFRTMERTIGFRFDDIAPRERIGLVDAPVMLVHGGADTTVTPRHFEDLIERAPEAETLLVEGADHASLDAFEPHIHRILGFLAQHLR